MEKNVDYIIVGCGLAGIAFCEQLSAHNKSFMVFDNNSQCSSVVAGGLYNPVVLKRFTPVWGSKEQLEIAMPYYKQLELKLGVKIDYKLSVLRRFTSLEEQNNWFIASDNPLLTPYMSLKLLQNANRSINAPFGFGEVLHSGRIDTTELIHRYRLYLQRFEKFVASDFQYCALKLLDNSVIYKGIKAKYVIFSEGYGVKFNPYFNSVPLNGTKGELLTIYAPALKLDTIIKSGIFLFPLDKDTYKVGATYEWVDKTNTTTLQGREELLTKLKTVVQCDFKVIDQVAGMRPTVKDRRPLVGRHPKYPMLYLLNGLGTRGVMIAPYAAQHLYNYIEENDTLPAEINVNRFKNVIVS